MINTGLPDIVSQNLRNILGTMCFSKGGAAIGTTKSKVKLAAAVNYSIGGKMYTKAITDDLWTLSGTTIPLLGTGRWLLCLNAAGTASVIQGTASAYPASVPVDSNGAPTVCPIAEVKVVCAGSATFVPGTTLLDATNVTATFTDLSLVPATGYGA